MNKHGVTLVELLIVIVVLGIIAAFTITSVGEIISNTADKVDEGNAEILADNIQKAADDGTIIIKNNRLFNTVSNRAYSGTGSWFFEDMAGYIENRVRPQSDVAKNTHNVDGDQLYKFWFRISSGNVEIFYYDSSRVRVVLITFRID